jgi:WD40 repeat protein
VGDKAVAFSPNGRHMATGSWDGIAHVFDSKTGKELARLHHAGAVNAITFSPDSRYLATGSEDGTARMFDAKTGKELARLVHKKAVSAIAFSPDGRYVATASVDGTARMFGAMSGKETWRQSHQTVGAIAFSPDGHDVATGSMGGTAQVVETSTGKSIDVLKDDYAVEAVAFSPDGGFLATAGGSYYAHRASVRVFNLSTRKDVLQTRFESPGANSVAFSPDGGYVAAGGWQTANVFRVARGDEVSRFNGSAPQRASAHMNPIVDFSEVTFSPDGRYVASSPEHAAVIFDVASGQEVSRIPSESWLRAIVFSPDGRYFCIASHNAVRVFETMTGKLVSQRFDASVDASIRSVGPYLLANSADGTSILNDAFNGHEVMRFDKQYAVSASSSDGRYVIGYSGDNLLQVFAVPDGRVVGRFTADTLPALLASSLNGRYIAARSGDGVEVFDTLNRQPRALLSTPGLVYAAFFSPDSRYLTTAGDTGAGGHDVLIIRHIFRTDDLISEACRRLTRNLSPFEWRQYFVEEPYHKTCLNLPSGEP